MKIFYPVYLGPKWVLIMKMLSHLGTAAALAFFTAYLVLKIRTDRNHDNLTNQELDWKHQLGM